MKRTPFPQIKRAAYVIEEEKLLDNLKIINDLKKKSGVTWVHALKAFAYGPLFPLIAEYLDGATGSSLNEVKLINDFMDCPSHTYAVTYMDHEIDEILSLSSHIVFNSLDEYNRYQTKASELKVSIGLRVNPGYSDAQVPLYDPARPGSRLGITDLKELPDSVEGLHAHVLCESTAEGLENLLTAIEDRFGHLFTQLNWINLGGGHLVTEKDYDRDHFVSVIRNFKKKYPHLEIILEPGAATVWQSGFLLATVQDIVDNDGTKTAILDVSFTAHMPDTLEMPYQPKLRSAASDASLTEVYNLGGTSCLAGDQIGSYSFTEPLEIGDQIILEDMIHYTLVKTTFFNGVAHPDIGWLGVDGDYKILKSYTYEDYKRLNC